MKVLGIVVTYNGSIWIANCLESLANSIMPLDVIVIDNQSTDNTVSIIEHNFSDVCLYQSKENLGFGKANNIGLRRVLEEKYDYAFLLNQDAWIAPDTIKVLTDTQQNDPAYGIISPLHVNAAKDKLDSKFIEYICQDPYKPFISDMVLNPNGLKDIYPVNFINAAAWLISGKCVEAVGGFDPIFPHYGEDNDYIQRAKYHQFKVGVCPKTSIVHDREGVVKQTDLKKSYAKHYVSSLKVLKNLEKPLSYTFFQWIGLQLRQLVKAMIRLDMAYGWMKVKLLFRVLANLGSIAKSRANSKNQMRAYL